MLGAVRSNSPVTMAALALKAGVTGGIAAICGLAWHNRSLSTQTRSADSRPRHVTIHMDINKTMIINDAVQGLSMKDSISTILADQACHGKVVDVGSAEGSQAPSAWAIHDKVWMPRMISTERVSAASSTDKLVSYGQFVWESLPYADGVDPDIKRKRLALRQQFTNVEHPGHEWHGVVDALQRKLEGQVVLPAFWRLIEYLHQRQREDPARTFSILFRTFGTDLPEIVQLFDDWCGSKGYDAVDWADAATKGVMVHHQGDVYLVVGCVDLDPRFDRVSKGCVVVCECVCFFAIDVCTE